MQVTRKELIELVELVRVTTSEEIDCSQFLERAAAYVDKTDPDEVPDDFVDVLQHMLVCKECCEELHVLRALVSSRADECDECDEHEHEH